MAVKEWMSERAGEREWLRRDWGFDVPVPRLPVVTASQRRAHRLHPRPSNSDIVVVHAPVSTFSNVSLYHFFVVRIWYLSESRLQFVKVMCMRVHDLMSIVNSSLGTAQELLLLWA